MNKKFKILFCLCLVTSIGFSQNKKDQIEALNFTFDSIVTILGNERQNNTISTNSLNNTIKLLETKLKNYEEEKIDKDVLVKELQSKIKLLQDSITKLIQNQIKTKTFKTALIGQQTWMTENLNVTTFQNGEVILEAKSISEWQKAITDKKPAFCFYDFDPKNIDMGLFYNSFVINHPNKLAPLGYHLPTLKDYSVLLQYIGCSFGDDLSIVDQSCGEELKGIGWIVGGRSSGFIASPMEMKYIENSKNNFSLEFEKEKYAAWWVAMDGANNSTQFHIFEDGNTLAIGFIEIESLFEGYTVRCLSD
jgi:uncharacterized protein (TIGR02145 family)